MPRTLDRYLLREIAVPFVIALVVLTFVLEIPPILRQAETLVAQGVAWPTILRVLVLLLPQALSLTIPMAVLMGILVGFGRLSADREFVALQACGVSLLRLLRPIAVVAVIGTAATAYQTIVALPNANQTFREITFGEFASRLENRIRPRVFFDGIPGKVIYVRDLPREGGWRDVFVAESAAGETTVYFAREGRFSIDRAKRLVQLHLTGGTSHWTTLGNADSYEGAHFERMSITLDPTSVFPPPPPKGAPEMTFAELDARIAEELAAGRPAHEFRFMVQQKWSLPATCPILALIGFALGATNRKDGKLASFALGFGVIFVYYVLLYASRSLALGGRIGPEWAPWVPNMLMGAAAVALTAWRARVADQPIRFSLPAFWRRAEPTPSPAAAAATPARKRPRVIIVLRLPHLNVPLPRLLDVYVGREYLRVFLLGVVSLLGVFYISTFIDLADKMFRGEATTGLVMRYFFFQTPQFVYYVIPMAVLLATLVTMGVLTKNSELTVMRACGISLYRTVAPLLIFGIATGLLLFGMQEQLLASANREADRLNRIIRGWEPLASAATRQWIMGSSGDVYHYDLFDPAVNRFSRLWVYHVDQARWGLAGIAFSEYVALERGTGEGPEWVGHQGWRREIDVPRKPGAATAVVKYTPFDTRVLALDPPGHFKAEPPAADLLADMMTFDQLRDYIVQLETGGSYAVPYTVALQRKIAFPFVTLIMTMLAIPFAMTTGRRGALYGIGVGIVLAIVYWVALSLFGALGAGGVIQPVLAAWAPNILFGAAAAYLILTVRT